MRRMLSRLLGWRRRDTVDLDVAREDWAPIPPAQVATDWGQWLQEEPGPIRTTAAANRTGAAAQSAPPQHRPRARIRTLPGERRWRDVLVAYAEHLTEEELLVIKRQMAD